MPSSGIGAATGVLAVGAPGAADALVVGRAAWAAVVSVLRPITMPTASSPTTQHHRRGAHARPCAAGASSARAPERPPRAAGARSSRRRANGAAADAQGRAVALPVMWFRARHTRDTRPPGTASGLRSPVRDARLFVGRLGEVAAGLEPVGGTSGKRPGEHAIEARQFRTLVAELGRRARRLSAGGAPVSR